MSAYRTAWSSPLVLSRDGIIERTAVSLSALGVSSVHQTYQLSIRAVESLPPPLSCVRQYSRHLPNCIVLNHLSEFTKPPVVVFFF